MDNTTSLLLQTLSEQRDSIRAALTSSIPSASSAKLASALPSSSSSPTAAISSPIDSMIIEKRILEEQIAEMKIACSGLKEAADIAKKWEAEAKRISHEKQLLQTENSLLLELVKNRSSVEEENAHKMAELAIQYEESISAIREERDLIVQTMSVNLNESQNEPLLLLDQTREEVELAKSTLLGMQSQIREQQSRLGELKQEIEWSTQLQQRKLHDITSTEQQSHNLQIENEMLQTQLHRMQEACVAADQAASSAQEKVEAMKRERESLLHHIRTLEMLIADLYNRKRSQVENGSQTNVTSTATHDAITQTAPTLTQFPSAIPSPLPPPPVVSSSLLPSSSSLSPSSASLSSPPKLYKLDLHPKIVKMFDVENVHWTSQHVLAGELNGRGLAVVQAAVSAATIQVLKPCTFGSFEIIITVSGQEDWWQRGNTICRYSSDGRYEIPFQQHGQQTLPKWNHRGTQVGTCFNKATNTGYIHCNRKIVEKFTVMKGVDPRMMIRVAAGGEFQMVQSCTLDELTSDPLQR